MNCTMSSLKLRKFPAWVLPRAWPGARAPIVPRPNITVLQLGPEVLPPGPAGNGKGIETLGSLPLVAPSLPLSVSVAEQGWSPTLLGPGRSRSSWKGRMRTGVGVGGGQKGKSHWRSVNQQQVRLSD